MPQKQKVLLSHPRPHRPRPRRRDLRRRHRSQLQAPRPQNLLESDEEQQQVSMMMKTPLQNMSETETKDGITKGAADEGCGESARAEAESTG